jgi:integrase
MPRVATGNAVKHGDKWFARVTVGPKQRKAVALPTCGPEDEDEARRRAGIMADLVAELRRQHREDFIPTTLEKVATLSGARLDGFVKLARGYAAGVESKATGTGADSTTFRKFAERWTSGALARDFPGLVKVKRTSKEDAYRLGKWVYPVLGPLPLADVTLDEYDALLRGLPTDTLSATSRRQVAQLVGRVLRLAVYPARLLKASPIPAGALPHRSAPKARAYLYPSEDRTLLACEAVPVVYRLLYGFLDREGMRTSEATALRWELLDLDRDVVSVETENKTEDYRTRPLDPGVAAALRAWRELRGEVKETDLVFLEEDGRAVNVDRLAEKLRAHLGLAKVERRELFARSDKRQRLRAHDLRATFVTLSLANGKSETWVADRTGHHSSAQIGNYRRAARTAAELRLGPLDPLDRAIPELRGKGNQGTGEGSDGTRRALKAARLTPRSAAKRRLATLRSRLAAFRFQRREA